MSFHLRWTADATAVFQQLQEAAERAPTTRHAAGKKAKSSKQEGLFKQVAKSVGQLASALHSGHTRARKTQSFFTLRRKRPVYLHCIAEKAWYFCAIARLKP